jgi:hypothetical protein
MKRCPIIAMMLLAAAIAGCGQADQRSASDQCLPEGYVFYLDGAGGGGLLNWSAGVREGLREAGYNGFGEMFSWETGLGPVADQIASVDYKRLKARDLVHRFDQHRQACDSDPMHIITLSAGSAIAVYALEEMPDGQFVDNVVMLAPSINADYDLSRALRHIRGRLYVFTSTGDAVLGSLVPLVGTADDVRGGQAAGLEGFRIPSGASPEARRLYAEKVQAVPWRQEFGDSGNFGGHLDSVNAVFIRDHVARLVMDSLPPSP